MQQELFLLFLVGALCTWGLVLGAYTSDWAVEIPDGNAETADAVATRHGFINMGPVSLSYIYSQDQILFLFKPFCVDGKKVVFVCKCGYLNCE